jgi:hypothetical protein
MGLELWIMSFFSFPVFSLLFSRFLSSQKSFPFNALD